ncbi:MAG TPA: P-loop NTPase [Candidatus Methylacidiphilales bacterium]|jgi:pilus assembly protein CpaE|nr:P-loop NTPase [Candidatus Methylacidiphilales bacterium]
MIDVFLVHDDVERCNAIRNAIKSNPELNLISETQTGREGLFAAATMLTGHPRMLIVRLNLGDMTGFDFIAQVRQKAHDIYIIPALEGTEGGQVWQNLLQLELRDVLVGPVPPQEISKVLATACPRAQERFDQNRAPANIEGEAFVISVVAARGGIGKSVVATNIAAAMAKLSDSVTLLDFSLNPGDFAVMLDDVPRNNIMDAVQQGGALDAEYLNNTLALHPRLRFRYLASPNQDFDSTGFDYNVGAAIMAATRTLSQYIVVDTGIAMAGPTIAAIDTSDIIFLITSRDVARLLSAKSLIKFLKNDRQVTNQKLKVLVNEAEIGAEISESEIESLLEHPVAAYLPCNAGPITFSINSGTPIVVAEPHHPISVVLNKLAELSFYRWQEKPSDATRTKKGIAATKGTGRMSVK